MNVSEQQHFVVSFFDVFIFQALISDGQRRVNHTLAKSGSGCLPFASESHSLTTGEDVSSLSPAFFKPWTKGPWCRELTYIQSRHKLVLFYVILFNSTSERLRLAPRKPAQPAFSKHAATDLSCVTQLAKLQQRELHTSHR